MYKIIFTCIVLLNISQLFAQTKSVPIEIKKGFMGRTYYSQNTRGFQIPPTQVFKIVSINEAALKDVRIAKSNFYPMALTVTTGSFILICGLYSVWDNSLGGTIDNKARTPLLFTLGAGLIVISIPLAKSYSKHLKNAVNIYNDGLKNKELNNTDIKIGMTNNGIALKINF